MSEDRSKAPARGAREDEGPLGPFFDALRAARPQPEQRLVLAVLADAAAEGSRTVSRSLPRWPAAAAAMAASVAVGFWLGATGIGLPPEDGLLDVETELEAVSTLEPDALGFFTLDWEG